jgi:hypothetical protein
MMKKILTLLLFATLIIGLTGCQTNSELDRLQFLLSESLDDLDLYDNPGESELDDQNVEDLMQDGSQGDVRTLAWQMSEVTLTTQEKLTLIRAEFAQIKATHLEIQTKRTELGIAFQSLKSDYALFKASESALTEDEIVLITSYIDEVKQIREDLKATIGLVYPKLRSLRGNYNMANIDLILTTYTDVSDVLDLRLAKVVRLQAIIAAVDQIILDRTE